MGQSRPIKMRVFHFCLIGKYFAKCSRPGMASTSFLSGTSLMASGTSLYTWVGGRVIWLVPSSEDTDIPSTSVQDVVLAMPSMVWVVRVVGMRCSFLMPNLEVTGG